MTRFTCQYCDKKFHYKEFYSKHKITCEFLSQTKRKKCSEQDSHEILPSPQEMYQLVQHLHLQCELLKDEIKKMKENPIKKSTKQLLEVYIPDVTYDDWVKLFTVNYSHVKMVFDYDLTEGIKMCINQRLDNEGYDTIPIQSKQKKVFIFNKKLWEICSDEVFTQMIELIRHEITRFFCTMTHKQGIDTDTEMMYLNKIMGTKINKIRQVNEIKSWLTSKISR